MIFPDEYILFKDLRFSSVKFFQDRMLLKCNGVSFYLLSNCGGVRALMCMPTCGLSEVSLALVIALRFSR